MAADFATHTDLCHTHLCLSRLLLSSIIASSSGNVGSWDSAKPAECPQSVWESIRWKRGGKCGEKQKTRFLTSVLEACPGFTEAEIHKHLVSLRLPFYYPPEGPSLAADRRTVIEEVIETPIEEPEEVTAEPSSRHEAVDVEELSSDLEPEVVTAEPTSASASHRERCPRRDIRVPPKARPRPSQALRPVFCTLPAFVESYRCDRGIVEEGRVLRPPVGSPCLFLDYHNVLDRTRNQRIPEGSEIPAAVQDLLERITGRAPSLQIYVLSFLRSEERRAKLIASLNASSRILPTLRNVITCAEKVGPTGKSATIRCIADIARASLVDDGTDIVNEARRSGIRALHCWVGHRSSWADEGIDWAHDVLGHEERIVEWANAVERNRY